jgi:hypothetical protein
MTIIGPYYASHGLLTNGNAATREEAMAKFGAAWDAVRKAIALSTSPTASKPLSLKPYGRGE